jgi:ribosome assembly protein 1
VFIVSAFQYPRIGADNSNRLRQRLNHSNSNSIDLGINKIIREFDNHIETGFQLGTFQGPLCAEPVEGLAYFVEQVSVDEEALKREMGATP